MRSIKLHPSYDSRESLINHVQARLSAALEEPVKPGPLLDLLGGLRPDLLVESPQGSIALTIQWHREGECWAFIKAAIARALFYESVFSPTIAFVYSGGMAQPPKLGPAENRLLSKHPSIRLILRDPGYR